MNATFRRAEEAYRETQRDARSEAPRRFRLRAAVLVPVYYDFVLDADNPAEACELAAEAVRQGIAGARPAPDHHSDVCVLGVQEIAGGRVSVHPVPEHFIPGTVVDRMGPHNVG